jgi:hypothetical protein
MWCQPRFGWLEVSSHDLREELDYIARIWSAQAMLRSRC